MVILTSFAIRALGFDEIEDRENSIPLKIRRGLIFYYINFKVVTNGKIYKYNLL